MKERREEGKEGKKGGREGGKEGKKERRERGKGKKFVASLEMDNGSREETFSVVSNRPRCVQEHGIKEQVKYFGNIRKYCRNTDFSSKPLEYTIMRVISFGNRNSVPFLTHINKEPSPLAFHWLHF